MTTRKSAKAAALDVSKEAEVMEAGRLQGEYGEDQPATEVAHLNDVDDTTDGLDPRFAAEAKKAEALDAMAAMTKVIVANPPTKTPAAKVAAAAAKADAEAAKPKAKPKAAAKSTAKLHVVKGETKRSKSGYATSDKLRCQHVHTTTGTRCSRALPEGIAFCDAHAEGTTCAKCQPRVAKGKAFRVHVTFAIDSEAFALANGEAPTSEWVRGLLVALAADKALASSGVEINVR